MKIWKFKIKKEYAIGAVALLGVLYFATRKREPETPEEIVDEVTNLVNRYFAMKKKTDAKQAFKSSVGDLLATKGTAPAAIEALSGEVIADTGDTIRTRRGDYKYTVHTVNTPKGRVVTSVQVHTPYKLGGKPWSFLVKEGWVAGL